MIGPDGALYFTANNGVNGIELWRSDGTSVTTTLLKDIAPGTTGSRPQALAMRDNTLYFAASDSAGIELWKSDGSAAGTTLVKDLTPQAGESSGISSIVAAADGVYFGANGGVRGLYRTDGTAAGTTLIADIAPAPTGGIRDLSAFGDSILFAGNTPELEKEPWISDGTPAGTRLLKDIAPTLAASLFRANLYDIGGQAVYVSADSTLRSSDGSAAGMHVLKDFYSVSNDSTRERSPVVLSGTLYFAGQDEINGGAGRELWRTDGTVQGTVLVADVDPGAAGSDPRYLTASGATLYFSANTTGLERELWKSNGSGTTLVRDIEPGAASSYPTRLEPDGRGGVYFAASTQAAGDELWHSAGTEATTRLVEDISPGNTSSGPDHLTHVGSKLFFTAYENVHGEELWVSDGTAAGTQLVRDITVGTNGSNFQTYNDDDSFAVTGRCRLFRSGDKRIWLRTLAQRWHGSGHTAGQRYLPGPGFERYRAHHSAGRCAVFCGDGRRWAAQLWRSDGSAAGTQAVVPGDAAPVNPDDFSVIDGALYFSAADSGYAHGRELWRSDGSAQGTAMLQDLNGGPEGSNPTQIVRAGQRLYLTAHQPRLGTVLWSAAISAATPTPVNPTPTGTGTATQRKLHLPLVRR